jgi:hypothetical protein
MEKFNKVLGIIGFILFLTGIIFKNLHLPGANALIIFGGGIGIIYFILSLFIREKMEGNNIAVVNSYFTSIAMVFSLLAFVFRTLHWPGNGPLLFLSSSLFFIMAIILTITVLSNNGHKFLPSSLYSFVVLYTIAILLFFAIPGFFTIEASI